MIPQVLRIWMQVIRIRFVVASAIAVTNGITLAFWKYKSFDPFYIALTFTGVICLHASVDLLNEYSDFKRGIDIVTKRTKYSGGTGVLPENLLRPKIVYRVGLIFLLLGSIIGLYFVAVRGVTIIIILGFAIIAIYFYSTSIVNSGLGEVFVAIKGTMIVLGTFYVQTGVIEPIAIYIGVIVGILSASVLFVNSFPDYDADRYYGRRTLVILLGKQHASKIFPLLIMIPFALVVIGIFLGYTKIFSLACFAAMPYAIKAGKDIVKYENIDKFVPAMAATVMYARITGFILAISLVL